MAIDFDHATLEDLNNLFKFIADNGKDFNYGVVPLHTAISILSVDRIRLENGVKYVTYPPYCVFITIRDIIEKYNDSKEVK